MNRSALQVVQTSFARCLGNDRFFDRFYEIFMSSDPAIKPMFAQTDMAMQKHLLRHGLMSVLMFAESETDEMARLCLDRIRETHGAQRMNIHPQLYSFWMESLLKTVAECDPEWRPEHAMLWRQILTPAVRHIESGYAA